ncbi:M15 family metallopeptidase [Paraclostridium bifermentans]
MKKGFRRSVIFIIIVFGFCYMLKGIELKLGNSNIPGVDIGLVDKNNLVKENNMNVKPERLLVNREHGLSKKYIPENLSIPNIPFTAEVDDKEKYVAEIIVKPLEELIDTAKKEGIILFGNSGYRSYKLQKNTYDKRVKSKGKELADAYVAKPGFSEHQTGLCIDVTNKDRYFVEGTKEADWLEKNAYRFGFIIRYPKGKKSITNINHEPWHIRYVGKKSAKYIYDEKITLEEYLDN